MPTDPQSLLDQARCLECAGSSDYGLDLMEVALLAKWANNSTMGCNTPGVMTIGSVGNNLGIPQITINATTGVPAPTVGVIVKWGTSQGGPYPNSKSFPVGSPYILDSSAGLLNSTQYFGVLFADSGGGCISAASTEWGGLTTPDSALNQEWQGRVTAAGGGQASANTYQANDAFWAAIPIGMQAKLKVANLFAPDSLAAARTPLLQGPGSASWAFSATNFLAGDITINGLGDPANTAKALFTGFAPAIFMTAATSHGCLYVSTDDTTFGSSDYGVNDATGVNDFNLSTHWTDNHTYAYNYGQPQFLDAGIISAGALNGYFCVSRTANNRVDLYFANSTNAHASKTNNVVVNAAVPPAVNTLFVFALNNNGALAQVSKKRLSAVTFGTGLSAAQSLILFNAIQAFRQKIGGGFA